MDSTLSHRETSAPAILLGTRVFSSKDCFHLSNVWNADSEPKHYPTKPNTRTLLSSPLWEPHHLQLEHFGEMKG